MEVENPKVKIRIVYKKKDKKIVGCQLGSSYDATAIIHFFSLAIQKGLTMPELPLVDLFFMPHFNQPYNYVTRTGLNWLNKGIRLKGLRNILKNGKNSYKLLRKSKSLV